jgi:hypothetical protein
MMIMSISIAERMETLGRAVMVKEALMEDDQGLSAMPNNAQLPRNTGPLSA